MPRLGVRTLPLSRGCHAAYLLIGRPVLTKSSPEVPVPPPACHLPRWRLTEDGTGTAILVTNLMVLTIRNRTRSSVAGWGR